MNNVERKFEQWSKKLYDISKKNYMINFTGQHYRSVRLTSPSMEKLYDLLVVNEKSLTFKRNISRDNNFYVFAVSTLLNSLGNFTSFKEGDIDVTTYKNKDAYDVLRNIKRVANDFKSEQGIDVLHITFGYIRWKIEGSNDYYTTPLINMPVSLEQENINSLYTVSKVSEPEINPIFKYMVEKQGITLPELNDKPINEYLKELDELANLNGWEIVYESSLCVLFFQKMVMFKDLENNKERIINHPLIKSFCDENEEAYNENDLIFDHDAENENQRLLVVEADSSQMDALTLASKGKSFVLQGPPGTGKSQTITNIIAQAMGQCKKVLFVSSKTAALEVVYNKLKQANLDDFVLALHNSKLNKAKVVNDVYAPYLLKKTIVKEEKLFELERMQALKQDINKYAKTINKKVYQLDMNFYDVIDEYYKVNTAMDLDFMIPSISQINKAKLNQVLAEIRMYQSKVNEYAEKSHSCYDYTTLTSLTFDEKETLEHNLQKAYDNISLIVENIDNINYFINDFYCNIEDSYNSILQLAKLVNLNVKEVDLDKLAYIDQVNEIMLLSNVIDNQKADLSNYFNENIFQEDLSDTIDNLNVLLDKVITDNLYFNNHNHKYVIENINEYKDALTTLISLTNRKFNTLSYLRDLLNVNTSQIELFDYQQILSLLKLDIQPFVIELATSNDIINELNEVIKYKNEVKHLQDSILVYATPSILDIDQNAINNYKYILSEQTSSFSLFFNSAKRKLREDVINTMAIHVKDNYKLTAEKLLPILELLSKYNNAELQHLDAYSKIKNKYNLPYVADSTKLLEQINQAKILVKLFNNVDINHLVKAVSMINKENLKQSLVDLIDINTQIVTLRKKYLISIIEDKYDDALININNVICMLDNIKPYVKKELSNIEAYYPLINSYYKNKIKYEDKSNGLSALYGINKQDYNDIVENNKGYKLYQEFSNTYEIDVNELINIINNNKSSIKNEINAFLVNFDKANESYQYVKSLFTNEKNLTAYSNEELLNLIEDCYNNTSSLKAKFILENSSKEYNEPYLENFISSCKSNNTIDDLTSIYLKKFYSKVILSFIYDNDSLNSLQKVELEGKIKEFDSLCKEQLEISKAIIRSNCLDKIPSLKTNLASNDERSYLLREYQRTRKQSIRKLFDNIPHLMLDLKPCLMMSPLTVSNYLENDNYVFDMIVFDEASQIRPEEAINSIYRGNQVIIAGDSKQLPPTNFFNKKEEEIDEDEEDEIILESMDESILEYANKKLPSITLLWHYRSKNENLIDFSNKNFYANDLITFPSVKRKDEDFGIEYIYVNGIYNKGKNTANEIEAERVLDLIDEHIEKYGNTRSLGVIAFGERQRNTIEKALIKYRKEKIDDKRYEAFFTAEVKEPFFVKNIESVQGDERDTIIFSIGYGKDQEGKFRYNFGPLQTSGGERRLNVAISRAKLNLKVVASFTPDEIDLSRIESVGVKLFKQYLTFAYNTSLNKLTYQENVEKGIKLKIAEFIKSCGFDVVLDYGYSSFKVDIAVVDKNDSNKFIGGILLDNQTYLEEKTCKDREILKKDILINNGWKILRVYSKFYIENEKEENKAIYKFIVGDNQKESNETITNLKDYVDEVTTSVETLNYGFDTFVPFDYSSYIDNNISIEGTLLSINDKLVNNILETLGVIHLNELIKQIADAFKVGEHRAKNRVLRIINDDKYVRDRMFIYLKGYNPNTVKKVVTDYKRNLEYVYPGEIKNCLLTILSNAIGLTRDGLIREAMIIFGIKSKSSRISDLLNIHINRLLSDNLISEVEGMLAIKEGNNNG